MLFRSPSIQRFTSEARRALEEKGYIIYDLTGQSIKTLRNAGKPFYSTWHKDYPNLEAIQSRLSEVAIDPKNLYLSDSNNKTLREQEVIVRKFSKGLKIDGVEVIIGEMPDYVELVFKHFDTTGDRLFGQTYNYGYARTVTPTSGSSVASVGGFNAGCGLRVCGWVRDCGFGGLWAAPLVVPAK